MVGPARGAGTPRPVQHDRPTESPNRDSTEPTGPPIRQLDQTAEPTDPPTRPDRPGRQLDRTANPPTAGPPTADPRTRPTVHTSRSPLVPAARLPPHLTSPSNLAWPRPSSPPRREWPGSRTHARTPTASPRLGPPPGRADRARDYKRQAARRPAPAARTIPVCRRATNGSGVGQRQPRQPTAAASAIASHISRRGLHPSPATRAPGALFPLPASGGLAPQRAPTFHVELDGADVLGRGIPLLLEASPRPRAAAPRAADSVSRHPSPPTRPSHRTSVRPATKADLTWPHPILATALVTRWRATLTGSTWNRFSAALGAGQGSTESAHRHPRRWASTPPLAPRPEHAHLRPAPADVSAHRPQPSSEPATGPGVKKTADGPPSRPPGRRGRRRFHSPADDLISAFIHTQREGLTLDFPSRAQAIGSDPQQL